MIKNIRDVVYIPDYLAVLCIFSKNKDMSVNSLHYEYRISYSSVHEMKKLFVEKGWVTIERSNGKHIVHITKTGEEVVEIIYNLIDKFGLSRDELLSLKLGSKHKVVKKNEIDKEHKTFDGVESTKEQDTNKGEVDEETNIPREILNDEKGFA